MSTALPRRPLWAGIVAALAVLCLGVSVSTANAGTLVGEQFVNAEHIEALTWEGECNTDGPSTFTFYVWGDATGPQPGNFEEYGIVTLASPSGPVTGFGSSWTIYGADSSVIGNRELGDAISGSCAKGTVGQDVFDVTVKAPYSAFDPFAETGPSLVEVDVVNGNGFTATFGETTTPPPPTQQPRTKDDCRKGGWRTYGFKNQGACIKAVVKSLKG